MKNKEQKEKQETKEIKSKKIIQSEGWDSEKKYVVDQENQIATPVRVQELPLTDEEKIVKFLDGKADYVKMNDFLKSLYPLPKMNEPAAWLDKGVSKALKATLERMVKDGMLLIANNTHLQLGKFYYEGQQQVQKHHNLTTIEIWAKI